MMTPDEAAALTIASREALGSRSAEGGDLPASVTIQDVSVEVVDDRHAAVLIRVHDDRHPQFALGVRLQVGRTFWDASGLDAEWAASHVVIYFEEAVWAGGHPDSWSSDDDGVRWYRDTML